ncbi:hypothetical protein VCV18_005948 [Metarhizium anisopliae]
MAMPYPEGEVFFKRSKLKIPQSKQPDAWSFNANNMKDFASHILVEYIYNRPGMVSGTRVSQCTAEIGDWKAYYPDCINAMFSSTLQNAPEKHNGSPGIPMNRRIELGPCRDAKEYRDNSSGGPDKVCIVPVPVQRKDKYMFIDLVVPLRAIYLPLAHQVSDLDPDLCTYVMIDFRFRKGVEMMFADGIMGTEDSTAATVSLIMGSGRPSHIDPISQTHPQHRKQRFSYKEGLGMHQDRTLGIDLTGVYNLLILPRQLRSPDKGLYKPKDPKDTLIRNYPKGFTNTTLYDCPRERRAFQPLDYAEVISDHFGVDVTWQPYEYKEETKSMIQDIFQIGVETGLSFIPVIGPLMSAGFSIGMEAINNPEAFKMDNILDLSEDVMKEVAETAVEVAKNLPKGKKGKKVIKLLV